jgi:hypothetical protein
MVNLSSCNSDFLSGLFADVVKANVLSDLGIAPKRTSDHMSDTSSEDSSHVVSATPSKKSRISLNRCFSRARASITNLTQLECQSPKGINNEFFGAPGNNQHMQANALSARQDYLAFQLSVVAGADSSDSQSQSVGDAARIAFPNLPATVSDSSCDAGLTRANLVRPVTIPENETKESFGWFVDLDDNQTTPEARVGLPYAVSSDDLAFQAPIAPRCVNDVAEVEWAKAADTVDDVLGDFF